MKLKIWKNLKNSILEEQKPEPIVDKPKTIEDCALFISKIFTDNARWTEHELMQISDLQNRARAGEPEAGTELTERIKQFLLQFEIHVEGVDTDTLAFELFKKNWGLDVIHDLYHSPDTFEVFVDRFNMISVSRLGKIEQVPGISFPDEKSVNRLVLRMITAEDAHFDESHPSIKCVRGDDSRLSAFRPPLTEHTCFALRKLNAVQIDEEYLIKSGTVNKKAWEIITLLARYGAKILLIGPPESGKTSTLRAMINLMEPSTRIVSIETQREIRIKHHYPERSAVEMEEHQRITGGTLKQLFADSLRLSATLLIFGEFRLEETDAAVMAGERARHFWSTSHFRTAREAIDGIADLLVSQGNVLSHDVGRKRVLRAFDTFITLYGDPHTGNKKVLEIETAYSDGSEVKSAKLVEWCGSGQDYWSGDWHFPQLPPDELISRMRMYGVDDAELKNVGWL